MTDPTPEPGALDGEGVLRSAVVTLQSYLDDFDRENADDIDNDDFNIGQDEHIEVPAATLRRVLDALSRPHVPAHSADAGDVVSGGEDADLFERLDAILVEQSPMHPVGCATWEEESRIAIDMAKERIAALRPSAGTGETVSVGHLTPEQQADIRSHVAGLSDPEEEFYTAPEHGWTCFHCGETFTTDRGAELHFGEDVKGRPVCQEAETALSSYEKACAFANTASPARIGYAEARQHVSDLRKRDFPRDGGMRAVTVIGGALLDLLHALYLAFCNKVRLL